MRSRVLADDLEFPEGPVLLGEDRLAFVEVRGQRVCVWEGGRVERIARTGGGPNGAALGPDGALWVTNNGGVAMGGMGGVWQAENPRTGVIQRVCLTGEVVDVVREVDGRPLQRPNDGCFGPDGCFYFTDPHDWTEPQRGGGPVVRCDPTGGAERISWLTQYPNGIAFGQDERLYVGETASAVIHVLDPVPGAKPHVFCRMPIGYPAGFCFDREGRLWVAGSFGDVVVVFEPDGSVHEILELEAGSEPSNCCLGDGVLYVTMAASGRLEAIDVAAEALALHPFRGPVRVAAEAAGRPPAREISHPEAPNQGRALRAGAGLRSLGRGPR